MIDIFFVVLLLISTLSWWSCIFSWLLFASRVIAWLNDGYIGLFSCARYVSVNHPEWKSSTLMVSFCNKKISSQLARSGHFVIVLTTQQSEIINPVIATCKITCTSAIGKCQKTLTTLALYKFWRLSRRLKSFHLRDNLYKWYWKMSMWFDSSWPA